MLGLSRYRIFLVKYAFFGQDKMNFKKLPKRDFSHEKENRVFCQKTEILELFCFLWVRIFPAKIHLIQQLQLTEFILVSFLSVPISLSFPMRRYVSFSKSSNSFLSMYTLEPLWLLIHKLVDLISFKDIAWNSKRDVPGLFMIFNKEAKARWEKNTLDVLETQILNKILLKWLFCNASFPFPWTEQIRLNSFLTLKISFFFSCLSLIWLLKFRRMGMGFYKIAVV